MFKGLFGKSESGELMGPSSVHRVVVVGDLMLDEYHWCDVTRLSPEAPVPVCKIRETTYVPGGASNVANNIQALGSIPVLVGILGEDATGQQFKEILNHLHLGLDFIVSDSVRPTTKKSRIVAQHQHVVRLDQEDASPISDVMAATVLEAFKGAISGSDVVILSDYNKGLLGERLVTQLVAATREARVPVIVDPKGHDYSKYAGATVLTPNFLEFEAACKHVMANEDEVLAHGLRLIKDLKLEALVVTRSEKGMSVIMNDGKKTDIATRAQEVSDITGAGDSVIAALALGIAAGFSLEKAADFANHAAGVVVGKVGTSTVSLTEIQDMYGEG